MVQLHVASCPIRKAQQAEMALRGAVQPAQVVGALEPVSPLAWAVSIKERVLAAGVRACSRRPQRVGPRGTREHLAALRATFFFRHRAGTF